MTGRDVELIRHAALLLKTEHPHESERLSELAERLAHYLVFGDSP